MMLNFCKKKSSKSVAKFSRPLISLLFTSRPLIKLRNNSSQIPFLFCQSILKALRPDIKLSALTSEKLQNLPNKNKAKQQTAFPIASDTFQIFYLLRPGRNQFSFFFFFYQNLCLSWSFSPSLWVLQAREEFYFFSFTFFRWKLA